MLSQDEQHISLEITELENQITQHSMQEIINPLCKHTISQLRKNCNLVLPMCSGLYRPESFMTALTEIFHAGGHFTLHIAHNTPYLGFILTAIGLVATVTSVAYEHIIVHQVMDKFEQLSVLSDHQRELIYRYICYHGVLLFSNHLETYPELEWRNILPKAFLASFFLCRHLGEDYDFLKIAEQWKINIKQMYQTTGAIMYEPKEQTFIRPKKDFLHSLRIQNALNDTSPPNAEDLVIPTITHFIDDMHRKIYQDILKYYEFRAQSSSFAAFFAGYNSEHLQLLKQLHKKLISAFRVIYNDWITESARPPNFDIQLELINTMFYATINEAAFRMPWHLTATKFTVETHLIRPYISSNKRPLTLVGEDKVKIECIVGELKLARERIRNLEPYVIQPDSGLNFATLIDTLNAKMENLEKANAILTARLTAQTKITSTEAANDPTLTHDEGQTASAQARRI